MPEVLTRGTGKPCAGAAPVQWYFRVDSPIEYEWVGLESKASKAAAPQPGALLDGQYRLHAEIARGGMGVVYRATDEHAGREVAVKVILAASLTPRSRQRFMRAG